nr:stromal processing peptidase, chloroplastic [Tanacetum cinerariifolium]
MSFEGPNSTICSDIVFRDWVNSYACDEIVLDIFYNGCFIIYPINYGEDALELKIYKVNKLSYKEMCDLLVEKVNEDIWHWFYCKPDCCLEEGLTIIENDMDVKIMYEMANLHVHLDVYVAHFPQYLVTDYYLKNLCVDETDDEVTKQLLSHQKIYKEVFGLSLEEMRKSLLDDFEKVEGEGEGAVTIIPGLLRRINNLEENARVNASEVFLKDTDERACAYVAGPALNRWGYTVDGTDLLESISNASANN